MANRADITQALTPSAPDVSGAVRAIQSQAGIAQTLFGGIAQRIDIYKKGVLEKAQSAAEEEQKKALVEDETFKLEQKAAAQNLGALQKGQAADLQDLSGFGITPEYIQSQGKQLPFQERLQEAASRLAEVQKQGGITPSQYFMRVKALVDQYAAKYPGSRAEIRKVVAEGSGLPGADLWAQKSFIDRLYTPPKVDTSPQKSFQDERENVVKVLGWNPVRAAQAQAANSPEWQQATRLAEEATMANAAVTQAEARQKSLQLTANNDFNKNIVLTRDIALGGAAAVGAKYLAQNLQRVNEFQQQLVTRGASPELNADINIFMDGLGNSIGQVFAAERLKIISDRGAYVSEENRQKALKELDDTKDALLTSFKTTQVGQLSFAAQTLLAANNQSLETRMKSANILNSYAQMFGPQSWFQQIMSNPEYQLDEKGNQKLGKDGQPILSESWANIKAYSPELYNHYRQLKEETLRIPIGNTARLVVASDPIIPAMKDSENSPNATPSSGLTKEQQKAARDAIVLNGVQIIGTSTETKLPAGTAQNIAFEIKRDTNVVGTALSNAGYGAGLVLISQNEDKFKEFMSSLTPEQSSPVKAAVNEVYSKSVMSSIVGIDEISSKYGLKKPMKLGIDANGNVGIIPPPKEWLEEAKGTGRNFMSTPASIRKYYKDPSKYYGGEPMIFKQEFMEEGQKIGKAIEEWNNKYLPRLVGSITSRGIVMGEDKAKVANEIVLNFQNGKSTYDFYSIPVPSVPTQGTSAGGGVVEGQGVAANQSKKFQVKDWNQQP